MFNLFKKPQPQFQAGDVLVLRGVTEPWERKRQVIILQVGIKKYLYAYLHEHNENLTIEELKKNYAHDSFTIEELESIYEKEA